MQSKVGEITGDELTVFFEFPVEIRKIIYTTNLIENLNKRSEYTKINHYALKMHSFVNE